MTRDGRDRYNKRHRRDSGYGVGESMPGEYGDSQGLDSDGAIGGDVIIDGKVATYDSYQRSSASERNSASQQRSTSAGGANKTSTDSVTQSEAAGRTVEIRLDSTGGTLECLGTYRNHQVHVDRGVPGEVVKVRLSTGPGYMVGERVRMRE